jgi:hypothetical protein
MLARGPNEYFLQAEVGNKDRIYSKDMKLGIFYTTLPGTFYPIHLFVALTAVFAIIFPTRGIYKLFGELFWKTL